MKLVVTDAQAKVLVRLRSPSARRAYLLFGFAREGYSNRGYTLRFDTDEPAVAAGDGIVYSISQKPADWQHSAGDLDSFFPFEVVIDHGQNVYSMVSGVRSTALQAGLPILRGDVIGPLVTNECFFGVRVNRDWINPVEISRHFVPMREQQVPGQGRKLRFGPDTLLRTLADGVSAVFRSGLRYFQNIWLSPLRFLVNVDFNGAGNKTGLAADGFTDADYWNVYAAGAFTATTESGGGGGYGYYYYYYYYCFGTTYSSNPQVFLYNENGVKTPVRLERVASALGTAGSGSMFDPMLSTWIGTSVPEENFFAIKGAPAGTYDLYLYSNNPSTFYVAVDNAAPTIKTTTTTASPAFVEDVNYVKYTVVVPSGSFISVKVYGYVAGLQLVKA